MKRLFSFFASFFLFCFLNTQISIGQRFIFTLPKNIERQYLKKWLSQTRPAGIMLQYYHVKNRDQLKELITFLQNEAKSLGLPKLFVSIDWEGGIVSRLNESSGFNSVPSPYNLCKSGRTYVYLAGKLIGQQLRSVGVNLNYAPSLDLFNHNNPVLATRTFSKKTNKIIECANAFINGLRSEGVFSVIKHFPGLGLCINDSHFEMVQINTSKEEFLKHIYPFEQLLDKQDNPFVLVGHASYPKFFDKEPSTLSSKVVSWIKRKNKDAILITDDFCMQAVRKNRSLTDASLMALKAGFNFVLFSSKTGEDIRLVNDIEKAVKNFNKQDLVIFNNNIKRIINLKNKTIKKEVNKDFLLPEKKIAKLLAQKSINNFYPNLKLNARNNILITINLSNIRSSESWFIKNNQSYLCKKLKKLKVDIEEFILDAKSEQNIKNLKPILNSSHIKNKNILIQTFFYSDGIWNEIQKKWLESLKPFENQLVVISLGHPLERTILPNAKIFNLGSFNKPIIQELSKRLVHKSEIIQSSTLLSDLQKYLEKKRFGLFCHIPSRILVDDKNQFLPNYLYNWAKAKKDCTQLKALFAPEHGLFGNIERTKKVKTQKDNQWNCPIYSLHGKHKKPTLKMLKDLDLLIVDLYEIGVRPFTYLSSLDLVMEAASENDIPVLIINHPNPIYFWNSQGPKLKNSCKSFVGRLNIPFMHGITIGEIANFINTKTNIDLMVINNLPRTSWKDYFRFKKFFPPSPNIVSLETLYTYPITVFLEGTNYSEGRGTRYPFQQIGAPWINADLLARELNNKNLPGVLFEAISFVPRSIKSKSEYPKHKDNICNGVFIHFYDLKSVKPITTSKEILSVLFKMYSKQSSFLKLGKSYFIDLLVGNSSWRKCLEKCQLI